ncbi:uncharacterized protein B0T15DRAFT_398837, partial [Chaetomium strumarium]
TTRKEPGSCSYHIGRAGRVPEVGRAQHDLIPSAAASPEHPRDNLPILKLPSSSCWHKIKLKSGTGIAGNNVATAHATSGGSRLPQPLRAGRLHCGNVGGTKVPPENVIVISDDEASDDEASDDEASDDESSNDESSDRQQSDKQQKRQASIPDYTIRNSDAPATDVASSREEGARQRSDGRNRSVSHDHYGGGDRTGGSARRHSPVPDETGEPTENDPVRLPQVQEHRASLSVLPDRQSISKPKPEDAKLTSQHWSSPSAASKRRGETQHWSGSSTLSQPYDHHGDRNQTIDPKQGDTWPPGDRGTRGMGSSIAASPVQEGGASVPQLPAAMSNNDRVLANVGPSASQGSIGLQQSLGRYPRSGTDVGENQRPAKDSIGEHGQGEVT